MSTTDPLAAKRFRASSYSGTHQAQVNAAINAANAYVAANPSAADLFDDSPRLYTLRNTDAKAAGSKAGPNALQAIAEDDVGGVTQITNSQCFAMKDNVRLEFSKDCSIPLGTPTLPNFVNINGIDNFTVTTKPGALTAARSGFGTNIKHPEWSAGKAVIDLRGSGPGSGSGLRLENNRMAEMDGTQGGGASHFKFQNLFIIANNDCAAPGAKQNVSLFTPKGPDQIAAAKYGIWMDMDFDGMYSGYGAWQISAVWRSLWANCRTHGGTLWRNESDAHFSGGQTANYGVSQVDFIAGYGEDMNKVITMQPNISKNFVSWYVDGIYGMSCLEVGNCGQFNGGTGTDQSFSHSYWGEIWHLSGDHSAWQEQSPCQVNDSVAVYAQSGGPLPGSIWQSMRFNYGHRGGPGHGVDGSGAEVTWASRADGTHTNGTRLSTMTADSLRAQWESKKVSLGGGGGGVTAPAAPTLSGPASPQTAPYGLTVTGATDKAGDWEWRLTTGGVAGSWVAGITGSASASKNYPGLTANTYQVEARVTNSAGTSAISPPFSFAVNAGGGVPTKAVITAGPSAATTLSTATFSFTATGATSLQTSVDGAAFLTTPSPQPLTGMTVGSHNFRVQGVNASGTGPMSDTYSWQVVSGGPVTAISAVTLSGTGIVDKAGSWAATDTTNLVIPFPNGIAIGDFMLLVVGWGTAGTVGLPSGWSALVNSPVNAASTLSLTVAQRVFTGTEGSLVTVVGPNASGGSGVILAVSGTYTVAPVAATSASSSG